MRNQTRILVHRRYTVASLIIFAMMLSFPFLMLSEKMRQIFSDWTPVAVEFSLLIGTCLVLSIAFLTEPNRMDEDGNVDFHWPP